MYSKNTCILVYNLIDISYSQDYNENSFLGGYEDED